MRRKKSDFMLVALQMSLNLLPQERGKVGDGVEGEERQSPAQVEG